MTPWVLVNTHSPFYNSNTAHHDEYEEVGLKALLEPLFHAHGVDLMFCGHVHAYERMHPVYQNKTTPGATTYINIGDGGNREGPAYTYLETPSWSDFHEPEFGFGRLHVYNATHAHWSWVRNRHHDVGDNVWLVKNSHLQQDLSKTGVTAITF